MMTSKCSRFLIVTALIFTCCCTPVKGSDDLNGTEEVDNYDKVTETYNEGGSTHTIETRLSHLDFRNAQELHDLATLDASEAANLVTSKLTHSINKRITKMFQKTKSAECRAKISTHFSYFLNSIGTESSPLPFAGNQQYFTKRTCPEPYLDFNNIPKNMTFEDIMMREYRPPRDEAEYIDDPQNLNLLYGILMHGDAKSTIRLIEALYEEGHTFVIHIDGKEESDEAYDILEEYARDKDYVYIIPHTYRVRVNWGGFSMVQATLNILKFSFGLFEDSTIQEPLEFHKFVHMAASSYPIRSNTEIRNELASFPLDANMMYLIMKPVQPDHRAWHYFVECDDALHRIYRLSPPHGVNLHTSSQWFIISREFAEYFATASDQPGTFVNEYIQYAEHMVVADEHFFGTVLRHTEFCTKHHNSNFLYLTFDRWESDMPNLERDPRKCVMVDPDKCGRSPTSLTTDDLVAMDISGALFARKFSDEVDSEIIPILEEQRAKKEQTLKDENPRKNVKEVNTEFEGLGALIVAKETKDSTNPLCLGLGPSGNTVRLVSCFKKVVVPTLSSDWDTGAVIKEEVKPNGRWSVGPCSSDGMLRRRADTAEMESAHGKYSPSGPHCMIKQFSGRRDGRCLDFPGDHAEWNGLVEVYPCMNNWHQIFGFSFHGKRGSIHQTLPSHLIRTRESTRFTQERNICLGASGRGDAHFEVRREDLNKLKVNATDFTPEEIDFLSIHDDGGDAHFEVRREDLNRLEVNATDFTLEENDLLNIRDDGSTYPPLSLWENKFLVTVPCSDEKAVIDFIFVPFIEEDEPLTSEEKKSDEL